MTDCQYLTETTKAETTQAETTQAETTQAETTQAETTQAETTQAVSPWADSLRPVDAECRGDAFGLCEGTYLYHYCRSI
jgi:hypothetical protein